MLEHFGGAQAAGLLRQASAAGGHGTAGRHQKRMVEGAAGVRAAHVDGVHTVDNVHTGLGGAHADRFVGLAGAASAQIAQHRSEGEVASGVIWRGEAPPPLNARLERAALSRTLHHGRVLPPDEERFGRHLSLGLSEGLVAASASASATATATATATPDANTNANASASAYTMPAERGVSAAAGCGDLFDRRSMGGMAFYGAAGRPGP